MLINYALAETVNNSAPAPNLLGTVLQFGLIFLVFYFLLIRPQQKRLKQHNQMLTAIVNGDLIVTGGGIMGKVAKIIDDKTLLVEINDEVKVKILRSTVSDVIKEEKK